MLKIKTSFHISWRQTLALLALGALIAVSRLGHVPAQTVLQGYNADNSIDSGLIVTLDPKDPNKVVTATSDNIDKLFGVTVDPRDAAVTLSSPNQKVFVATGGSFTALVSTQNGPIKANDYISISSLEGIGMKVRPDQTVAIGRAITDFDGKTNVISTADVNDGTTTKPTALGKVTVAINVIRNPVAGTGSANLPGFLQSASSNIAGKNVNAVRVWISIGLLIVCAIISGSLLYAGVRSSIVAVGRNPLSKTSILRSLTQVILTSLIVFIGGLFGVYLLLKL